ncbi:hypothetical protein [Nissabacter sp. SGAir0207]|uniref:hypothetical protein n=1 Tax=Nissabacter sp. SGAir0207 TaxID=2126321 RepID=UPI0010CCE4C0|nr:hypothetical protein [Nissabacter sp. SGAir0207]QCR35258.1 hypothetical protein C1N62_03745 [Nissabacter sp. SGAir0207]
MIEEGRLLSRHGFTKTNSWITIVISALLMLAGAMLVLFLLTAKRAEDDRVHFTLLAGMACILLGVTLLVLRQLIKPKQTYELHENGVLVINQHNQKDHFIPFERICDIYRYRSGNYTGKVINAMAFRTDIYSAWNKISPHVAGSARLIEVIIDQQLTHRGAAALTMLANDGHVSFFYLPRSRSLLKRLLTRNFLMMKEKQLRLSALSLSSEDQVVSIDQVHRVIAGTPTQPIELLDAQDRVLFSIPYLSLFSAELFVALLEHMIQSRIPIQG